MSEQLGKLKLLSREQIIALATAEYKELFGTSLSEKESSEQSISLLNLFGALTERGKEREDEA